MFIKKLKIHDFRNINHNVYDFNKRVNVFYGANGAGKTSILESIYFLSSGKSFRKGNYKNLISFNSDSLTVYAECKNNNDNSTHALAVSKNQKGLWKAKYNNSNVKSQSIITNLLPVVAIDPEVYRLVDFGPLYRRNFIDWLVFHVKHEYLTLWKKTHKCVKQLNALYKSKANQAEVEMWENNFIQFSTELNAIREQVFNQIKPKIISFSQYMQDEIVDLELHFKKGWSDDLSLTEQLNLDRNKNFKYGQLLHGPQKMDIKITVGKHQASQTLSRGQKKILSITFYMAFIDLLLNQTNKLPILCLDDFDAEIDIVKLKKAARFFDDQNTQIFITSVQKNKIQKVFPEADMFHVKHS